MCVRRRVARFLGCLTVVLAVASCSGNSSDGGGATAPSNGSFNAEQFFAGKTIRVIVTHTAGGGADLFGRFIADRLGKYIPGQPRVTVTNENGLGGIASVYDAPAESLVVGVTSQASALYTNALDPAAKFDAAKIRMVGGTGGEPRALASFGDVAQAYPSLADASGKSGPPLKFAQSVGSPADLVSDSFFASWLCETLSAPCQMISVADDDSQDLNLMLLRNEINMYGTGIVTILREFKAGLQDGSVKIAFGYAPDQHTEVTPPANVPVKDIKEVIPAGAVADYERILPIIGPGDLGKSFWVGPATFPDVLEALRSAYSELVADPAVVDELQGVMAGAGNGDANFSWKVFAMSGQDAQAIYDKSTGTFNDNLPYYQELQQKYFDKYWS